jgi:GT2 family glycosyltransferase
MHDLAIIIASCKTRDPLDRCLASIFAGSYPFSYRVVVVDNASEDGTPEMVICKYPDALLIRNEKNTGFSVANNQGIRKTDSRHVLLLDPGAEPVPETLAAMVKFLDSHQHVGIVGCQLLNGDGSLQTSWFNFPAPMGRAIKNKAFYPGFSRFLLGIKGERPLVVESGARRVDIVKDACLMIRRQAVNQIGLLDENLFLCTNDIDWCIRARRKGWEVYALTDRKMVHSGYAGKDREPFLEIASSRRSELYLYRKHYSFPVAAVWSMLVYSEIFYKWLLNGIRVRASGENKNAANRQKAYRELLFGNKSGGRKT